MAVSNVAHLPVARKLPFSCNLPRPYENVRLEVDRNALELYFEYQGSAADLVSCGAISEKLTVRQQGNRRVVDEDGDRVLRKLPRCINGRMTVIRYKRPEIAERLPGFQPWMIDAFKKAHEEAEELMRDRARKRAEEEMDRQGPVYGTLSPDAYRAHCAKIVGKFWDPEWVLHSIIPHRNWVLLEDGYQIPDADIAALRARTQEALEALASMVSRLRIARTAPRMRIVVDNRQGEP